MSLAETQELMRTMQELMVLLGHVEAKTTRLNDELPRTKETMGTFRELERVAVRYLALARRMGLPDDSTKAIEVLSRLVVLAGMAQMSFNMLMRMTPYGWLMGVAGIAMTGLSFYDSLTGV
jgi:hypothetical protein